MKKLPILLLLDSSGSMRGEPIEAVKIGLRTFQAALAQDALAQENVEVAIFTFDREVQNLLPLTPLAQFVIPPIYTPDSGPTHLGKALEKMVEISLNLAPESYHPPFLFLMTDGNPSDLALYHEMCSKIKKTGLGAILACAAGPKAEISFLQELTPKVLSLSEVNRHSFQKMFHWVAQEILTQKHT